MHFSWPKHLNLSWDIDDGKMRINTFVLIYFYVVKIDTHQNWHWCLSIKSTIDNPSDSVSKLCNPSGVDVSYSTRHVEESWHHLMKSEDTAKFKQIAVCNFDFLLAAVSTSKLLTTLILLKRIFFFSVSPLRNIIWSRLFCQRFALFWNRFFTTPSIQKESLLEYKTM